MISKMGIPGGISVLVRRYLCTESTPGMAHFIYCFLLGFFKPSKPNHFFFSISFFFSNRWLSTRLYLGCPSVRLTIVQVSDVPVYHARTQAWKTPSFRGFWTKKKPLFQPNSAIRWFWGPTKHPLLKQNAISFLWYKVKCPFCEREINCTKQFYCVHRIFHYV